MLDVVENKAIPPPQKKNNGWSKTISETSMRDSYGIFIKHIIFVGLTVFFEKARLFQCF